MIARVAVALLALTAGCGRPCPGQPVVAMYGDSTTSGYTLTPTGYAMLADSEPADVARLTGLQVLNLGVGGTGIADLDPATVAGSTGDVVVVNYGLNDCSYGPGPFTQHLDAVLAAARGAGKQLVVETSNPFTAPEPESWNTDCLGPLVDVELSWAALHGVPVVNQYAYPVNCPDGIHPDAAGYEAKAERLVEVLRGLVAP